MVNFWHRLLNKHEWEEVDEYRIEGINLERSGFEGSGFGIEETMDRLRRGYKVVHQKCKLCGDRRTLKVY